MARTKFEDEVTVIRVFTPDEEKMTEALMYILNMPEKKEKEEGQYEQGAS